MTIQGLGDPCEGVDAIRRIARAVGIDVSCPNPNFGRFPGYNPGNLPKFGLGWGTVADEAGIRENLTIRQIPFGEPNTIHGS